MELKSCFTLVTKFDIWTQSFDENERGLNLILLFLQTLLFVWSYDGESFNKIEWSFNLILIKL